jgi:Tfp pilus assembly major pilin PilA
MTAPESATSMPPEPIGEEALFRAVIQKNIDYYLPRMQRYAKGERSFPSWNWPALFASGFWALYRKSWAAALFFVAIGVAVQVVQSVVGRAFGPGSLRNVAVILLGAVAWVVPPLFANGFYYRKVRKLIAGARAVAPDPQAQLGYLAAKGGTSKVWIVPLVVVAVAGMLAAIALPAYQDYVARTKVIEAIAAVKPLQTEFEDAMARTGKAPDTVHYAWMQSAPGAKYLANVKVDPINGALVLTFNDLVGGSGVGGRMSGKSLALVLSGRAPEVSWKCRNIDAPPAIVPKECRQP